MATTLTGARHSMTGQGFTVAVSVLLRPVAPPEVASATIVTAPVEP